VDINIMMETYITIIISSITGVITYFVGRKRKTKELDSLTLINIEKSLEIYNTIINDLKGQVEELLIKVNSLEDKINILTTENHELKEMLRNANTKSKK